jgi:hypothetical protein
MRKYVDWIEVDSIEVDWIVDRIEEALWRGG